MEEGVERIEILSTKKKNPPFSNKIFYENHQNDLHQTCHFLCPFASIDTSVMIKKKCKLF